MKEWPSPLHLLASVSTVERALCAQERPCGEEVATGSAVSVAVQQEDSIRAPRLPNKAGGSFPWNSGGENLFPTGVNTVLAQWANQARSRQRETKRSKEDL